MRFLITTMLVIFSVTSYAQESSVASKIEAAMAADIRTEEEVARDKNRKPVETLEFLRLKGDMRVL